MGALDLLLERNTAQGKPFAQGGWPKLCLVTCDDAALTGQLEACLGLQPGDAGVVRLPGGGGFAPEVVLRAVAKAVLVDNCDEVLLLTHSSCALARVTVDALASALNRAGVPRAAVPSDLRELVGASREPREAARELAAQLRQCAFLPRTLLVHVGHLDEATGRLTLVENGEQLQAARPAAPASTARQVAGYQPGPAAAAEPSLPAAAIALPTFTDFTPISVELPVAATMPALTVELPRVTELPAVTLALPAATALPALTIALPPIGELNTFSPSAAEPAPIQVAMPELTVSLESKPTPPPVRPVTPASRPNADARPSRQDAKKTKGRKPPPSPAAQAPALGAELATAVDKVRTFLLSQLPREDRQRLSNELAGLAQTNPSSDELLKAAFQPILASEARYRVLDELLMIKDALSRLPASKIIGLLQSMLR